MNFQEYIKKVYTIAFRLTGEESSADDMASIAINNISYNIKEDNIDLNILHNTAKEVCNIFLLEPDKYCSKTFTNQITVQNTLLNLEPLTRAAVVWKDIMGFNINDLAAASNCPKLELYKKLNSARKQLLNSGTVGMGELYEI